MAVVGGTFSAGLGTVLNGTSWVFLSSRATLTLPALSSWLTMAYVCLLISDEVRRRYGWLLLCGGLIALNAQTWGGILGREDRLEMHVLDVGQGDAIFLRFPNGKTMFVDCGPRTNWQDAGERVVLPFLRQAGVSRLDVMVASHPHSDHIGGLITVLEHYGGRDLHRSRAAVRFLDGPADMGCDRRAGGRTRRGGCRGLAFGFGRVWSCYRHLPS